jgi:hypothetical protein
MLRQIRLFQIQPLGESTDSQFALSQQVEDRDSRRVGESLKDLGFELAEGIRHSTFIIFESSHTRKWLQSGIDVFTSARREFLLPAMNGSAAGTFGDIFSRSGFGVAVAHRGKMAVITMIQEARVCSGSRMPEHNALFV